VTAEKNEVILQVESKTPAPGGILRILAARRDLAKPNTTESIAALFRLQPN
jgi:hypothetical protein